MALVTGLTAARMLAIEAASVVDGDVVGDDLILTKHDGSVINAGNVRGPQGIAGQNAATGSVSPVANTTPIRDASGRVKTAPPVAADDAATKLYADTIIKSVELDATVDLNTLITPGVYTQALSAEATLAKNYPTTLAGFIEVFAAHSGMVWQRFTPYGLYAKHIYQRSLYSTTWYPWKLIGTAALPDPQQVNSPSQISITSTTPVDVPGLDTIVIDAPEAMWVDLRFKAWMVASAGETRASIVLTGATASGWPLVQHANTLYVSAADSAVTAPRMVAQAFKLNAGVTTIKAQAYYSTTGTHQVSYPVLEVVPLRWA